jgi:hypothetical protein
MIYHRRQLVVWDDDGVPMVADRRGQWVPIDDEPGQG